MAEANRLTDESKEAPMAISKTAPGLRREMSFLDLTMACLGAMIGSGWLLGALAAAGMAGPASVLAWLIGGIAVLLIGLVYAELSGMLPEAGGIARYPHFTHGSLTGWMMGWGAFLAYASVPAIEAEAVTQYASRYIPALYPAAGSKAIATPTGLVVDFVLVILFFLVNSLGVKIFAKTNTTITMVKTIMPSLTILVFLFAAHHWGNFTAPAGGGFAPFGVAGVLKAVGLSGIIFSFLGFRQAVDLAAEAKNPQRDLPRAIMIAVGIALVVYTLLQVAFIIGVPGTALAKGWTSINYSAPYAQLAGALGLGWLAVLLYADAVISPAGTGNVYAASTARVAYALGQNRYVPKLLTKVSSNGIPIVAQVVGVIFTAAFLLPFPSWTSLVGVISAATVFTYIIGPVSAVVLRRTEPQARRPFRLAGMGVVAPAAFVIGSLIIYWTGWKVDWKLAVAILGGAAIWAIAVKGSGGALAELKAADVTAAAWLIVYVLFMLAATYLGSARFGSPFDHAHGLVHYPFDLVGVTIGSLVFYYWGVASGRRSAEGTAAIERVESELAAGNGARHTAMAMGDSPEPVKGPHGLGSASA